jgi:hypothetical protein
MRSIQEGNSASIDEEKYSSGQSDITGISEE